MYKRENFILVAKNVRSADRMLSIEVYKWNRKEKKKKHDHVLWHEPTAWNRYFTAGILHKIVIVIAEFKLQRAHPYCNPCVKVDCSSQFQAL